jgi:hypothetical protein
MNDQKSLVVGTPMHRGFREGVATVGDAIVREASHGTTRWVNRTTSDG